MSECYEDVYVVGEGGGRVALPDHIRDIKGLLSRRVSLNPSVRTDTGCVNSQHGAPPSSVVCPVLGFS
jgi:hypothetical protein